MSCRSSSSISSSAAEHFIIRAIGTRLRQRRQGFEQIRIVDQEIQPEERGPDSGPDSVQRGTLLSENLAGRGLVSGSEPGTENLHLYPGKHRERGPDSGPDSVIQDRKMQEANLRGNAVSSELSSEGKNKAKEEQWIEKRFHVVATGRLDPEAKEKTGELEALPPTDQL